MLYLNKFFNIPLLIQTFQIFESPYGNQEFITDQFSPLQEMTLASDANFQLQVLQFQDEYTEQDQDFYQQLNNLNQQRYFKSLDEISTPRQKSIVVNTKQVINVIEAKELADLLYSTIITQEHDTQSSELINIKLFDCRWPYEYQAGHIVSSVNSYDGEQFRQQLKHCNDGIINYAIFYCEYSQVRARKMYQYCDHLYQQKEFNTPIEHILLLNKGFNNFYEKYPDLIVGNYVSEKSNLQLQQYYSHDSVYDMNIQW